MGHDPSQVSTLVIWALSGVAVVTLLVLVQSLVNRRRFSDWPPFYEWQQARRPLRRTDRWRVIWATERHRPTGRAALADAQLAHARYLQARAQRALDRRRRTRGWQVAPLVVLGIVAVYFAAQAATHSQQRTADIVGAAGPALAIVGSLLESSRSLRRRVERMARLTDSLTRPAETWETTHELRSRR